MSLYGMLFGRNPHADELLGVLGLTKGDVGRFRDCFIDDDEETLRIAVYTRNGGGNREDYEDVFDDLSGHPNYLYDCDDDFDCTYATIYFSVPDAARDLVEFLAGIQPEGVSDPQARFDALMEVLRKGDTSDPAVPNALKVGEQIIGKIAEAASRPAHGGEASR